MTAASRYRGPMRALAARPTRPLRSPHGAWRFRPLTAQELLAALAAVPGVRPIPAADGIVDGRLVGGVEVARVETADDAELRRAWKSRFGGGPTPLLLLTDDADAEGVAAIGPLAGDGPLRRVDADELRRVLERLPSLGRLEAVRRLAEELERLDRAGVSGLRVRGLGTQHLFAERLRGRQEWPRLEELAADLPRDWRQLLERLGYEVEQLPQRNYVARFQGAEVALVRPLADAGAFAKLDADGRLPEGVLVEDCRTRNVRYGLLASRGRLRLFDAAPESGSAVARYLELDAATLAPDDRPLLGLLSPEYLAAGAFDSLLRDARDFGVKLRRDVDRAIRQSVLPALAEELGDWAAREKLDVRDDATRAELEAAALTFVFRSLFLLYAESARHLPVDREAYRPHSFTQIVRDAYGGVAPRSTTLWERIKVLVAALREGEDAWLVPAYNGALFAADGFEGAEILERASLRNAALAPALVALGIDAASGDGYDFSGLEIGHLGHIYEGLLSLRLSVADRPYWYDEKKDRYELEGEDEPVAGAGDLLWLTDEGGRKGGGVYYTPEPLVRHLVRRGVVPAFERHLAEVEALDPAAAAKRLFEFRVLDPACGSAHFLVAVVDELADATARFLARRPLPALRAQLDELRAGGGNYGVGIEDAALLRRLVLKHCVYGVDVSPMGAEIAKISLWLASFVPGLALSYLDGNVKTGNSLIGVADLESVEDFAGDVVREAVTRGAALAHELAESQDRTPDEVEHSKELEARRAEVVEEAKARLDEWLPDAARVAGAFHWPLEFPEVFLAGGFDAVVGNPPWEEVTVEELAFYARYRPGLRGLPAAERARELAALQAARPELAERLRDELARVAAQRRYFASDPGYTGGAGDPDLYKFFCQRYRRVLGRGGALAVVLPRSAFAAKGSADFRDWLLGETSVDRLDFLLNSGRWAFDAEPRYTVSLLVTRATAAAEDHSFEVAGVAASAAEFAVQIAGKGVLLGRATLGERLEVPLLPSQAHAQVLTRLRSGGTAFPFGGGRWQCFGVGELHETNDKKLWEGATDGRPLWKGASFDQYDPHGADARVCPFTGAVLAKVRKPRPGAESLVAERVPARERAAAVERDRERARIAFRDVSRATDSRTVRAALVPPQTFLTNKAPYLAFIDGGDPERACCLGLMNSLPFDWQARRFVETNVNFFVLEGLRVPKLDDRKFERIARAAARLSTPDERFAEFAVATGVDLGPLTQEQRDALRAEIDALVAHAYGLTADDLETIFADFTLDAVPEAYRARVRKQFRELAPRNGEPGYFPDHVEEWRHDYARTTPAERVAEGIALSQFATRISVAGRKQ